MAGLLYHTFAFLSLFSYGLYHLISSTRSFLKPPNSTPNSNSNSKPYSYSARPYHPLPHRSLLLRNLPLFLSLFSLLLSLSHSLFLSLSPSSSPLLRLSSLQSTAVLLLFLLLSLSLLLFPLPSDLSFLLSSLAFALFSLLSSHSPPSDLESKCGSISSSIFAASALFSLVLSAFPNLFVFDLALAGSISLQGLWSLQTGLSLYVEGFIPEGCHRLLDVKESSTRCDLEEMRVRAGEVLDLAFVMHAVFVAAMAVAVYAVVARVSGGGGGGGGGLGRRFNGGSYEALPTSSSVGGGISEMDHVQMKAISKNSAQE